MPMQSFGAVYTISYDSAKGEIAVTASYRGMDSHVWSDAVKALSDAFFIAWLVSPSIGFPRWESSPVAAAKVKGLREFSGGELVRALALADALGFNPEDFWPKDSAEVAVSFAKVKEQPRGWKYRADIRSVIPNPDRLIVQAFVSVLSDDVKAFVEWLKPAVGQNARVAKLRAASYGYRMSFSGFSLL